MQSQQVQQFFVRYKIAALLLAVTAIWIFFQVGTDNAFVTPRNVANLLRQMSITGMLACGMVFVIIAGEIDLSVGALLGLVGGVAAILTVKMGWGTSAAIAASLGVGLALGAFNGMLVTKLRVPSFIVGLGGMLAFRGVLLGVTGGATIAPVPAELIYLGQGLVPIGVSRGIAVLIFAGLIAAAVMRRRRRAGLGLALNPLWTDVAELTVIAVVIFAALLMLNEAGGVPLPVMLLLALLAIFSWIASQTVFGRHIYAVGGNMEATRLSGVNVTRVKLAVFTLMGLMAAFAGIINTARLAAGSPSAGTNGELDAIAACFIGGTSMRGGVGTVQGALIGALVMASLDNGMSMMDVDTYWQMIVKGSILVLAVWVDVLSGSHRG